MEPTRPKPSIPHCVHQGALHLDPRGTGPKGLAGDNDAAFVAGHHIDNAHKRAFGPPG